MAIKNNFSSSACAKPETFRPDGPRELFGRADDGDACGEVGEHVSLQAALDQ